MVGIVHCTGCRPSQFTVKTQCALVVRAVSALGPRLEGAVAPPVPDAMQGAVSSRGGNERAAGAQATVGECQGGCDALAHHALPAGPGAGHLVQGVLGHDVHHVQGHPHPRRQLDSPPGRLPLPTQGGLCLCCTVTTLRSAQNEIDMISAGACAKQAESRVSSTVRPVPPSCQALSTPRHSQQSSRICCAGTREGAREEVKASPGEGGGHLQHSGARDGVAFGPSDARVERLLLRQCDGVPVLSVHLPPPAPTPSYPPPCTLCVSPLQFD